MKIEIKQLGVIGKAEFTLADLTIICGENNTGKTYATYALYGFLDSWNRYFSIKITDRELDSLLNEGSIQLDLQHYISDARKIVKSGCRRYSEGLSHVFASSEKRFKDSQFLVHLDFKTIQPTSKYTRLMGAAKTDLLSINKHSDSSFVTISLLVEKKKLKIPEQLLREVISTAIKDIIFGHYFPHPFIVSAERTGAAIFRNELNFARNRLLEEMNSKEKELDPFKLLSKMYSDYALPVKSNVEFTRQLEDISKRESFISDHYPELLNDFADIIGGEYVVKKDELYFIPKKKARVKLTMDESSSAVRSLLDIGFYIRHKAAEGDLLMVDEPELNLHPENQRRLARLFARLVNLGIKVFITTHSDYIIKELNTLIMLNQGNERLIDLAEKEGYVASEFLDPEKVRVYIAEEGLVTLDGARKRLRRITFNQAGINENGIEARSFDTTIQEMNRIQDEIVWGGNGDD